MKLKHGVYVGYIERLKGEGCLIQIDKDTPSFVWCQFDNMSLPNVACNWHRFNSKDIKEDARD